MNPLLTIITVNRNNAIGLKRTINSVIPQLQFEIEYIIIDGASTDGSVKLAEGVQNKLAYWVSENDNGIYHAMNKGIKNAKGDYILFLNSGDVLIQDISLIFPAIEHRPDIFSAAILVEKENNSVILRLPIVHFKKTDIMLNCLPHQSTLIKRSLFQQYGYYDESFQIAADLEFWLRICPHSIRYTYSFTVLSRMEKEGLGASRNETHFTERLRIFKRYYNGLALNLDLLRLMYRNRKLIVWYLLSKLGIGTFKNNNR